MCWLIPHSTNIYGLTWQGCLVIISCACTHMLAPVHVQKHAYKPNTNVTCACTLNACPQWPTGSGVIKNSPWVQMLTRWFSATCGLSTHAGMQPWSKPQLRTNTTLLFICPFSSLVSGKIYRKHNLYSGCSRCSCHAGRQSVVLFAVTVWNKPNPSYTARACWVTPLLLFLSFSLRLRWFQKVDR